MAKCGLFYGEYPDSIEFVIFGRGVWYRKMRFVHNADQVFGTWLKKKFLFSGVSTMCLQLGSGANQPVINCHELATDCNHLDGVNKMVLIRQTSEFGSVLLRSLARVGDYFPL